MFFFSSLLQVHGVVFSAFETTPAYLQEALQAICLASDRSYREWSMHAQSKYYHCFAARQVPAQAATAHEAMFFGAT